MLVPQHISEEQFSHYFTEMISCLSTSSLLKYIVCHQLTLALIVLMGEYTLVSPSLIRDL